VKGKVLHRLETRAFQIDLEKVRALAKIQEEEDRRFMMGVFGYLWVDDERDETDAASGSVL